MPQAYRRDMGCQPAHLRPIESTIVVGTVRPVTGRSLFLAPKVKRAAHEYQSLSHAPRSAGANRTPPYSAVPRTTLHPAFHSIHLSPSTMQSINRFLYGPTAEEKVRAWQSKLRSEQRALDREMRQVRCNRCRLGPWLTVQTSHRLA